MSSSQYVSRNYIAQVQKAWKNLSTANESDWFNYISLNPSTQNKNSAIELSAYNLFLKYNLIRLHSGMSILETITFDYILEQAFVFELYIGPSGFVLELGFDLSSYDQYILVKLTPPFSTGKYSVYKRLRVIQPNNVPTTEVLLEDNYEAIFGDLPSIGDIVRMQFLTFSTDAPAIGQMFDLNLEVLEE